MLKRAGTLRGANRAVWTRPTAMTYPRSLSDHSISERFVARRRHSPAFFSNQNRRRCPSFRAVITSSRTCFSTSLTGCAGRVVTAYRRPGNLISHAGSALLLFCRNSIRRSFAGSQCSVYDGGPSLGTERAGQLGCQWGEF